MIHEAFDWLFDSFPDSLIHCFSDWWMCGLIDTLIEWMIDWLVDLSIDCFVASLIHWLIHWFIDSFWKGLAWSCWFEPLICWLIKLICQTSFYRVCSRNRRCIWRNYLTPPRTPFYHKLPAIARTIFYSIWRRTRCVFAWTNRTILWHSKLRHGIPWWSGSSSGTGWTYRGPAILLPNHYHGKQKIPSKDIWSVTMHGHY